MVKTDALIDELAESALPVRAQSVRSGRSALVAVAAATLAATVALLGIREDIVRFAPAPEVAISGGLMVLLAIAAGTGAVRIARPEVGARASGAPWALAALLVVSAAALAGIAAQPAPLAALGPTEGLRCLAVGLVAGLATIVSLTVWQRRGAPVRPDSAAWLAGLAGGAVGAVSVTIECPVDGLAHIGVWHIAAVPLSGLAARLALPPLIRW